MYSTRFTGKGNPLSSAPNLPPPKAVRAPGRNSSPGGISLPWAASRTLGGGAALSRPAVGVLAFRGQPQEPWAGALPFPAPQSGPQVARWGRRPCIYGFQWASQHVCRIFPPGNSYLFVEFKEYCVLQVSGTEGEMAKGVVCKRISKCWTWKLGKGGG